MANDLFTVAINYESQNYSQAVNEYDKFVDTTKKGTQAERQASKASETNAKSKRVLTRATRETGNAQQRVRQQFLATANSIAVLDGPLGGVASRFSAFGVLIGRIGIPLAAASIGFATLTFAAQRAIREFIELEVNIRTIENRLNSFGNQIGFTSDEIIRMSNEIARTTLADERQVLAAAGQLLTFRNITTDIFEDVLKSAQDLAASGFGTLESESLRLAKALEDPRQGLTSLSRAGITFTRQQRQMIIALIDSGRQAEAYQTIMKGVERQVGGAGNAQANETLAGSFDTIGQAMRAVNVDLAEGVLKFTGLRNIIDETAKRADRFLQRRNISPEDALQAVVGMSSPDIENLNKAYNELFAIMDRFELTEVGLSRFLPNVDDFERARAIVEEALDIIITANKELAAIQQAESQIERRVEGLENLRAQIDLQRESIGLTQDELRVRQALIAEGFGGNIVRNIEAEINQLATSMAQAGRGADEIADAVTRARERLEGARDVADQLLKALQDQRTARELNRIKESIQGGNETLRIQIRLMEEGATQTEAARLATVELERQQIQTAIATEKVAIAAAAIAMNFDAAFEAGGRLLSLMNTLAGLDEREDLLTRRAALARPPGGGGSGAGSEGPTAFERLIQEVERRQQLLGLTEEQVRAQEMLFRIQDAAAQSGIALGDERIAQLHQEMMLVEKQMQQQEELRKAQERAAERMTNLFMAATQGSDSFKRALGQVIQELARMAAMQAFKSVIGGPSGSILTSIFGFSANAKGNIFNNGNIQPFAKGGVVGSPTLFPMGGRKTGLMGEAGPEAIMPLKRNSRGELGVEGGGETSVVSVTYAPNINVKGSGEEVTALRQEIARMNAEAPARIVETVRQAQKKRVL